MPRRQHIQLVLIAIEAPILEPEDAAGDEGNHGHGAVVPDEQRIRGQRDEGLADGGGDGGHEEREGRDEGAHVLGRFREAVFE